jgi:uncharacterized protein (TIGR03663 family)
VASAQQGGPGDEWRLGVELGEPHEHPPGAPAAGPGADLSEARLNRPLQIVTVEHLGWFAVALWTLITRLVVLGARPLSAREAGHALFEYDLAFGTREAASTGYHAAWSGWVHFAQAGVFTAVGANDFTARLIFMLAGLLTVAMAFAMRHYLGRAGAIALGTLFATSPSLTYFSRASEPIVAAVAMTTVVMAVFLALVDQPGMRRAAGLGCAGGLMVAADPTGLVTVATFLLAFTGLGLWELVAGRNTYLRLRVWRDRYSSLLVMVIVTGATTWVLSELAFFGRIQTASIGRSLQTLWGGGAPGYRDGLLFYFPALALYEFPIMITGVAGALAIIAWRVPSRFARFCAVWALASFAYYLWAPVREPARVLQMILPAAFVGAFFVDYLHHTYVWRFARYPVVMFVLVAVYVQVLSNFVYSAPDASEAPWARHANLYWRGGATTLQTRDRIAEALKPLSPADATVFLSGEWPPALRWYLRALRPALNPDTAAVVVDLAPATEGSADADKYQFDFEQSWEGPQVRTAGRDTAPRSFDGAPAPVGARQLLHYALTSRIWGHVEGRAVGITVRPSSTSAPTVILAPGASR